MIFAVIIIFILFIILAIFSFPQLSPIPYFPSNRKDLPLIIESLKLKNDQTVIDLGAGDGVVIFEAAKKAYKEKLNTKFIAVDINPILLFIMHLRCFLHPNRRNIKIIYGDIFTMDFNSLTRKPVNSLTFYLYISPWYLEKVISNFKLQISNYSIVSYMYPIKSLKKYEKRISAYKHPVFIYTLSPHYAPAPNRSG